MSGIGTGISFGLRDLLHDRSGFLTQVLALVAVLLPLLVLYSLRVGVVSTLVERLAEDPRNRQIVAMQQGHYDAAFFTGLRADPRVAFVVGHASPIAREVAFSKAMEGVAPRAEGVVLGSGPGDPLLGRRPVPPGPLDAVVTQSLAARLGVGEGERIVLSAVRRQRGADEALALELKVAGIIAAAAWEADGALLAEDTLSAVEQWRDGMAVPAFGWSGGTGGAPFAYRNFRLYARDLPSLRSLHADLLARGLAVSAPRLRDFESVMSLNEALGTIFTVIAGAGGAGFLLSFGSMLWGNVVRKRKALSVLRLHGLPRESATLFPVAQAVAVAVAGWVLASGLYIGAAAALNRSLGDKLLVSGTVSRLAADHFGAALALTVGAALLASLTAAWQVTRIQPGEGMHGA